MAEEIARFQNFAKLKDTQIAFNDITVLAGKPGTGKSYVMKFMYAINETISSILDGSFKKHYALMGDTSDNEQVLILSMKNLIKISQALNTLLENNNYIEAYKLFCNEKNMIEKDNKEKSNIFIPLIETILKKLSKKEEDSLLKSEEEKFHFIFRNILTSIFTDINQVDSEFEFENDVLKIIYRENELEIDKLNLNSKMNNALFVETPLILEFEKFLPSERFKTPYHIDSLLQELNKNDFSFTSDETNDFINQFKKSTSTIINGNISKGSQGFSFELDTGKSFNIINASSGIKSIGLLQYLVTNKALKKGSILFWEEPEVHLHPEWQLKMVELFVELMNAGVKIVFSTHSTFMADSLNALSKKKDFADRVTFNLFKENNGIVENHILDTDEKWKLIQDELLKSSLEEIMWQYL